MSVSTCVTIGSLPDAGSVDAAAPASPRRPRPPTQYSVPGTRYSVSDPGRRPDHPVGPRAGRARGVKPKVRVRRGCRVDVLRRTTYRNPRPYRVRAVGPGGPD